MKNPVKKFIAFLPACFFLYKSSGFPVLPFLPGTILTDKTSQSLQKVVTFEYFRMNPIENPATNEKEEAEPFASIGKFHINLLSKSQFKKSFIFKELLGI